MWITNHVTLNGIDHFLTIAGCLCIFSNVYNVYGKDLVLLRQPVLHHDNSILNRLIHFWNLKRNELGMLPFSGWPLSLSMFLIAVTTTLLIVTSGYMMMLKKKICT